ncbi:ATP-binding protein [Streptomyces ziwulingensis]|uniref:histidine kinase n=1 Tax=Streptomyces ziwulingensis TaxID=1045501 RepID=A0ABP9ANJ0_9ACTN
MEPILITALALLAVGATGSAVHHRIAARSQRRRADRLGQRVAQAQEQLVAAEQLVRHVAISVVPAAAAAAQAGQPYGPDVVMPPQLANTSLASALRVLTDHVVSALFVTVRAVQDSAQERVTQTRVEAERQIAEARGESVNVARAAVRAFSASVVQHAAKLSGRISDGVRRHLGDESYATLVEIDHLGQQMLRTASGYTVLAGGKLSRHWPATTVTDVVRSAMGQVEHYQRVQHTEFDSHAVQSRAVAAVVHCLADLLNNAVQYSPPSAKVYVSVEQSATGVLLIVDDSGLPMEDEKLHWARGVLAGKQRDDITQLGAHPQTGLRIAAVLADAYGFRVDLTTPNVYGGNRAVIVLPQSLLTAPARPEPSSVPAARLTPVPPAGQSLASATTAGGLTVRQRGTRHAAPPRTASEPARPGSPAVAAAWAAGSRRGRREDIPTTTDEGHRS